MRLTAMIPAAALLAMAPAAHASVVWNFYETELTSDFCARCALPPQPFVLATLTLPDTTSNGSASWAGFPGPGPVYQGDSFTFKIANNDAPVSPAFTGNPSCGSGGTLGSICSFELSWNETAGSLDGVAVRVDWFSDEIGSPTSFAPFGLIGGVIASDGELGGCHLTECQVTGYWVDGPNQVSEGSSVAMIAIALTAMAGFAMRRRLPSLR